MSLAVLELGRLEPGPGRAYAPIVWLALASHLRWREAHHRVWPSNSGLASMTGLPPRCVELGLAHLRAHGRIEIGRGWRGLRYRWGRIITMIFEGPNPRVRWPSSAEVKELWSRLRRERERPASAFALALAAEIYAAMGEGRNQRQCKVSMAALARLVGSSRGSSFNGRLATLERVGLLSRLGETWRSGFALLSVALDRLRRSATRPPIRLPDPPLRRISISASERLAEMSGAFARIYA